MKIAIISDIHDNIVNLEKSLIWCNKNSIAALICCGDVTNIDTLDYLTTNFKESIHLVSGNADSFGESEIKNFSNLNFYGRIAQFKISGKTIGMCHEPFLFEKVLESGDCDIVFYGHTHKPWEEKIKGVRFLNPGTLSGMFQMATFAVYDTVSGEVVLQLVDRL